MGAATVTSKGQLTIPAEVRAAFGIEAGHKIHFFKRLDGELGVKIVKSRKGAGFGALRLYAEAGRSGPSREDIGDAVTGEVRP